MKLCFEILSCQIWYIFLKINENLIIVIITIIIIISVIIVIIFSIAYASLVYLKLHFINFWLWILNIILGLFSFMCLIHLKDNVQHFISIMSHKNILFYITNNSLFSLPQI